LASDDWHVLEYAQGLSCLVWDLGLPYIPAP